jgi:hypothetical protein
LEKTVSKSEKTTQTSSGADDAGQAQVQAAVDEAAEKGYFGNVPEREPNESFTLAGVTKK